MTSLVLDEQSERQEVLLCSCTWFEDAKKKRGQKDTRTWGHEDMRIEYTRTRGHWDMGTQGHWETGTWKHDDMWIWGYEDMRKRGHKDKRIRDRGCMRSEPFFPCGQSWTLPRYVGDSPCPSGKWKWIICILDIFGFCGCHRFLSVIVLHSHLPRRPWTPKKTRQEPW